MDKKNLFMYCGIGIVATILSVASIGLLRTHKKKNKNKKLIPQKSGIDGDVLFKSYNLNHGLGYLTASEVAEAVNIVKEIHHDNLSNIQFIDVNCYDYTKEELASYALKGLQVMRKAEVITMDVPNNRTIIDIIELPNSSKAMGINVNEKQQSPPKTTILQDVQSGLSPDEYAFVEKVTKAYQPLRDVIASRGLDPEGIVADAWCCGSGPDCDPKERICWPNLFYLDPKVDDLCYSRPIEGIDIRISLTHKKIIKFDYSTFHTFPIPASNESKSNYVPREQQRTDIKPIVITQPDGPSWKVSKTNCVEWGRWSFQVGFNGKEGASLNGICFHGRPVLHKFSFCEMVVPYGDPRSPHCLKNAFDAGEDGLGRNANSLVLGCDCVGVIHYFDGNLVNDAGDVTIIKNAICMHEEDAGLGWKHTDWRTAEPNMRRDRKLIIQFVCTIANYEYSFNVELHLTGAIDVDVKLTGALSTGALTAEEQAAGGRKYGINLGPTLYAPVHQHFFVSRMDFAIDGTQNRFIEYNASKDTLGSHNPTGNAFYYEDNVFETEQEAIRDGYYYNSLQLLLIFNFIIIIIIIITIKNRCSDTARFWKIESSTERNSIGYPTAYKIVADTTIKPIADLSTATNLKRALFLNHQIWCTPYDQSQRYPGGEFPNQLVGVDGLPKWTKANRSILDTDIVLWHVFGVTHLPRPEDWPIMPVEHCGFHLKPSSFFSHSPVTDTKQQEATHCCK